MKTNPSPAATGRDAPRPRTDTARPAPAVEIDEAIREIARMSGAPAELVRLCLTMAIGKGQIEASSDGRRIGPGPRIATLGRPESRTHADILDDADAATLAFRLAVKSMAEDDARAVAGDIAAGRPPRRQPRRS